MQKHDFKFILNTKKMSKLPSKLKSAGSKQLKLDKLLTPSSPLLPSTSKVRPRSRSPSIETAVPKKKLNSEDESETSKKFPLFQSSLKSIIKTEGTLPTSQLEEEIKSKRIELFESISAFRFNKKRVRVLTDANEIPEDSQGLLYWMSREQRVQGTIKSTLTHLILNPLNLFYIKRQLVFTLRAKTCS